MAGEMTREEWWAKRLAEKGPWQVLAIDPGGTTGWAVVEERKGADNNCAVIASGQLTGLEKPGQWDDPHTPDEISASELAMVRRLRSHITKEIKVMVIEDFILVPNPKTTARSGLSPVRITARIQQMLADDPVGSTRPLFFQSASMAKSTVTDERMRRWGIWVPGAPHANDAIRHGVTFMRRKAAGEIRV